MLLCRGAARFRRIINPKINPLRPGWKRSRLLSMRCVAWGAQRRVVGIEDLAVPVLTLEYEAVAYAEIGRHERAELLREHCGRPHL